MDEPTRQYLSGRLIMIPIFRSCGVQKGIQSSERKDLESLLTLTTAEPKLNSWGWVDRTLKKKLLTYEKRLFMLSKEFDTLRIIIPWLIRSRTQAVNHQATSSIPGTGWSHRSRTKLIRYELDRSNHTSLWRRQSKKISNQICKQNRLKKAGTKV